MTDLHLHCSLCPFEFRFRFYEDYSRLEKHFKASHFICDDPFCRSKGFIAFATLVELETHKLKVHTNAVTDDLSIK